jgi:hypothetical protein
MARLKLNSHYFYSADNIVLSQYAKGYLPEIYFILQYYNRNTPSDEDSGRE